MKVLLILKRTLLYLYLTNKPKMKIKSLSLRSVEKKPLFLVMQREYFDQIESGKKTEEYRHGGKFYISRFCKTDKATGKIIAMRNYTSAILQEGYNPGARRILIEVKKIEYDGEFTIYLGNISERLNFDNKSLKKAKKAKDHTDYSKPVKTSQDLLAKVRNNRRRKI